MLPEPRGRCFGTRRGLGWRLTRMRSAQRIGSMMLLKMESVEAVRKYAESDPYSTGKVWDTEKVSFGASSLLSLL